ncbi:hypothetical protein HGRIS_004949 [Hohenbuehelia grisea]|uniref:Protein kinase domain-containing protein n=1 Tax=Hohenbuehelia grisea TaxID=104357 RepID=A0ABR3JE38_9AGAR
MKGLFQLLFQPHPAQRTASNDEIFVQDTPEESQVSDGPPVVFPDLVITEFDQLPLATSDFSTLHLGVYRKEDGVKLKVVVKSIHWDYSRSNEELELAKNAYLKRSAAWLKLAHPNVLPFLGSYTSEITGVLPASVVPYCENNTIMRYLRRRTDVARLPLIIGIAKGLEYLHKGGVIHGCLTTANILILDDGTPAITDLGRSGIVESTGHTTRAGGRSRWLPPEYLYEGYSKSRSKAGDVYTFALTMLTVITSKSPYLSLFKDRTEAYGILTIARGAASLQRDDYPEMDDKLWAIGEKCWNSQRHARTDITTTLEGLEALLEPQIVMK